MGLGRRSGGRVQGGDLRASGAQFRRKGGGVPQRFNVGSHPGRLSRGASSSVLEHGIRRIMRSEVTQGPHRPSMTASSAQGLTWISRRSYPAIVAKLAKQRPADRRRKGRSSRAPCFRAMTTERKFAWAGTLHAVGRVRRSDLHTEAQRHSNGKKRIARRVGRTALSDRAAYVRMALKPSALSHGMPIMRSPALRRAGRVLTGIIVVLKANA